MKEVLAFLLDQINDEWDRLLREFVQISPEAFTWQPDPNLHSIGWHVRHVIEWRYALVHAMILRQPNQEKLYCLGWETDPVVQKLAANPAVWYEPRFTVGENVQFADRIRGITNPEIGGLPPARFSEEMAFPWKASSRVLDEIAEELRHSALHRGHVQELKKLYARRGGQSGHRVIG
jgi:hypothetical protein